MLFSVSGVHLSAASPELIHDHSSPSTGHLPSDALVSTPDDTRADSSLVSQTIPKAQIQQSAHTHLNIPLFPLGLTDETSHGAIALEDEPEGPGADASNSRLHRKISSLETKLKASEEEKQRIKKVSVHLPGSADACVLVTQLKVPWVVGSGQSHHTVRAGT